MGNDTVSLDDQLAELRKSYVKQLPNKLAEIRKAQEDALSTSYNQEAMFKFYRLAHSLAGSGAIYGFAVIGDKARALELALKPHADAMTPPPDALLQTIQQQLQDLEVLIEQVTSQPI